MSEGQRENPGQAKHTALRAGQLTHTVYSLRWGREGAEREHRLGGAQSQLLDAEKGLGDRRDTVRYPDLLLIFVEG